VERLSAALSAKIADAEDWETQIWLWLCQDRWHSKFRGSCTLPLGFTLSSGLGSSNHCTFRTNTSRATKPIHSRRKLCHSPDHSTNIHMSHSSLNWHSSSSQSQSGTNSCWRPQEKSWTTSCHICPTGIRDILRRRATWPRGQEIPAVLAIPLPLYVHARLSKLKTQINTKYMFMINSSSPQLASK